MNYRYGYLWAAPGIEPSIRIPLGCARNLAVHRTLAIEIKTLTSYNRRCLEIRRHDISADIILSLVLVAKGKET